MKNLNLYFKKKKVLALTFFVVIVFFGFLFQNKLPLSNSNLNVNTNDEGKELTKKLGKLMFVPKDEIPTVATVANPEDLKGQSFFIDAKIGDKVLIYKNARKAVLYDPIANKIITIAPLILGDEGKTNTEGLSAPVLRF